MGARTGKQFGNRPLAGHGATIDLVGGHGVVSVHDSNDARAERQVVAAYSVAAATAVPPGEGVVHNRQDVLRGAAAHQDLPTRLTVPVDRRHLLAVEPSRLEQDAVGYANLADVVQQGSDLQLAQLLFLQLQFEAPHRAAQGDAQAVRGGGRVLGAEGGKQTGGQSQSRTNKMAFRCQLEDKSTLGRPLLHRVLGWRCVRRSAVRAARRCRERKRRRIAVQGRGWSLPYYASNCLPCAPRTREVACPRQSSC